MALEKIRRTLVMKILFKKTMEHPYYASRFCKNNRAKTKKGKNDRGCPQTGTLIPS
jgi:hypothetical protein